MLLEHLKAYRRWRGGRWGKVTGRLFGHRWLPLSHECHERADEDYSVGIKLNALLPREVNKERPFYHSFDGKVWATSFIWIAKQHPEIATDEATMTGWFANALMRGYDEAISRFASDEPSRHVQFQRQFNQTEATEPDREKN